ncbi:hypothetical protein IscW_ISCW009369 [Ixodes scapularis]|uniref:Interferon-related developmental regulator N-terminal domain-containing protein n=1 Tax=Ixodes scapularis TaxID=6945 RepID=B7PYE9_IXOSC|nr:hypothetical protein IscW_ISCW009369 [Ixodes scapularis]|eukprot:XP_002403045.1 hypothetical protein IscW_ISCW009369 [Ixodes scapularis]
MRERWPWPCCRHLPRLQELLESPDLELRIAAGEVIAVMYEGARDYDEHMVNMASCRARTKTRNRLRDKRADVVA